MSFETVDDILAYYGRGGEEEKEDDSEGPDVLPRSGKDESQ